MFSFPVVYLCPSYGGGNEDNGNLLQNVPCMHCYTQCPQPTQQATADPWLLDTYRQVWVSLLWGSLLLSPGSWCTRFCFCPARVCFPVLCKFWEMFWVGVNCDLLQEGLCHTQVCCSQSPCPWDSPLLTHTSTGYTQTQFCLSLCGFSGSWCNQGLFELSEHF